MDSASCPIRFESSGDRRRYVSNWPIEINCLRVDNARFVRFRNAFEHIIGIRRRINAAMLQLCNLPSISYHVLLLIQTESDEAGKIIQLKKTRSR